MSQILVIDDDHDILRLVKTLLHSAGYVAFTADSAEAGIEILGTTNVDAILTDINMPGTNGFDLLQALKNNLANKDLPVAMLTGEREITSIEKALKLGVNDYIVKPLDPIRFLFKVEKLLEGKKPTKRKEPIYNFSPRSPDSNGFIKENIKIISLSEMGLKIRSSLKYKTGSVIKLGFDVFDRLKIGSPELQVLSCEKNQDNSFTVILGFNSSDELVRNKIRSWVSAQVGNKVA